MGKKSACQRRGPELDPWSGKILYAHNKAHVPQLLSARAATAETHAPRVCALQQEGGPCSLQLKKAMRSNEEAAQPNINR